MELLVEMSAADVPLFFMPAFVERASVAHDMRPCGPVSTVSSWVVSNVRRNQTRSKTPEKRACVQITD
jgi:hypothetical protein